VVNPNDAWKIPSREEVCSGCSLALDPGCEVTVRLAFGEDGPQREDLCASCGEAVGNEAAGIFWKRAQPEQGDTRPVVDYIFLQEMFGRLLEREEEVYRRLSYLVGLVLIRKRHLRLKGFAARDGREVMIVSRGAGQPELVVPAPFLSAEDMADTREMLTQLLAADLPEGDLPEPRDPEPANADAAPADAKPANAEPADAEPADAAPGDAAPGDVDPEAPA